MRHESVASNKNTSNLFNEYVMSGSVNTRISCHLDELSVTCVARLSVNRDIFSFSGSFLAASRLLGHLAFIFPKVYLVCRNTLGELRASVVSLGCVT